MNTIADEKLQSQVIPDSLRTDWSKAGYTGTIPSPGLIINVKDFGAYGDSIHDDYAAVSAAISSSFNFRVIYFPAGKYLIKTTLTLPSNVVLRGEGSTNTNLCFNLTTGDCIDIKSTQTNAFVNIDSGYSKGSAVLSVSKAAMLKTGSYAEIRETNGSWDVVPASYAKYCVGQIVKINSIQNALVYIDDALRMKYDKTLVPQIRIINPVQNTGIECLKVTRVDSTPNNYGYNIAFVYAENCWVSGVECNKSQGSHIMINASAHINVSGCYFHDAFTYDGTGTAGYGVTMIEHSSDCKVENSVFRHLRHSMIAKQGANGNIFGYNYSFDPNRTEIPNDGGGDLLLHGHYAFANLFEGNIAQNIICDETWGPSGPYNTFFRNRAQLYGIAVINSSVPSNLENYVGNEVTDTDSSKGYFNLAGNNDFSYANNVKGFIEPAGTGALADSSYYLHTQPYFWNMADAWPSAGIPVALNAGSNPAKERYDSGSVLTSCQKQMAGLSIVVSADSITCNGSVDTINITASGGTAPYAYSINGINFQTQNNFEKTAGTYTITVADAAADTVNTFITIAQPSKLAATLKKVNLTCYNDSSGSITVTAGGGIKPYQYSLAAASFQLNNIFSGLKAGSYVITVKDARGCTLTLAAAAITQPSAISVSTVTKSVSCKNASDGSITITASKGVSPYQYSLNNGAYQTSNIFSNLSAGTYSIKVQDAKGCTAAKTGIKISNSTTACSLGALANRLTVLTVSASPDPFQTSFKIIITGNSNAPADIMVTDVYGRQVEHITGKINSTYTMGSALAAGVYFVEVLQDGSLKTLRVIKQ